MTRLPARILFFSYLCLLCSSLSYAEVPQSADALVKVRQAAVEILIDGKLNGSGWIASRSGAVITAAHVVWSPHEKIEVMSPGIGRMEAEVVATDPAHDLARLQIKTLKGAVPNFPMIELAKSQPVEGSDVFLYGSALFRHWITLKGCMSRREPGYEFISTMGIYCRFSIIAAPSPQGTSGGCWVDSSGRVIGNQSGFINDNGNNPSGLAIVAPVDAIKAIMTQTGDAKVATLGCGLEEVFSQSAGFLKRLPAGSMGLFTVPIREGGAAAAAGLTSETLITHINGAAVTYRRDFMAEFRKAKPGDEVRLTVISPENHSPREIVVVPKLVSREVKK